MEVGTFQSKLELDALTQNFSKKDPRQKPKQKPQQNKYTERQIFYLKQVLDQYNIFYI